MPLVLVEDVADHAVAAPAHDVVVLAAFLEMDLGAEILARLAAVLGVAHHEARRGEGARTHLVDEIDLAAVADFQPNPAVLAVLHLDFVALLAQFGGDVLAGRSRHIGDEAVRLGNMAMLRRRRCQPSPSLAPLRVVGREKVSAW